MKKVLKFIKNENVSKIISVRNIVFFAMLFVGILCFVMSASNTTNYLKMTGINGTIAVMTGIALIIFSSTAMTSSQFFLAQKGAIKFFAIPFLVIGSFVVLFSVFSTLSLNYATWRESDAIQKEIAMKSAIISENLKNERQSTTDWAKEKIDKMVEKSLETNESWAVTIGQISSFLQNATENEKNQSEVEVPIEILPASFFDFLLKIKTIDTKYSFDFFMLVLPAIFYDLLSPLAISIVLLLLRLETATETESEETEEEEIEKDEPSEEKSNEEENQEIDLRTLFVEKAKAEEQRNEQKEKVKKSSKNGAFEYLERNPSATCKEFCETTGMSERVFYKYKKDLERKIENE